MNKKILFCGGGNMAEGIIRGLIDDGIAKENIFVNDLNEDRCGFLNETYGVTADTDLKKLIDDIDVIVIAVLPRIVPIVASNIKPYVKKDTLVISIAAGVKLENLEEALGGSCRIARIMPNTLGVSKHGYSAVCLNKNIIECDKAVVETIIGVLGQIMYIEEDMFNTFTAFSCSGPMWMYKMAEAMITAGVYEGFSRRDATNMVLENMIGAAQVLKITGDNATSKVNAMCSPGGVTIEGLKYLNSEGFDAVIMKSVNEAVDKAKRL